MRIENTSLQPSGSSPVDKLRRPSSVDSTMDDLDLSFMDLLSNIVADSIVNPPEKPAVEKTPEKEKAASSNTSKPTKDANKLTLVGHVSASHATDSSDSVDHDLIMLKDALTPTDLQYMKQAVIPGLPILMGSVPVNSIFPTDGDGEISYRGFDVSTELAELIEKGYRTGSPIRVELDTDSAVVLKIRNGQVSAQFVSNDKNAGAAMQQSLDDLRNRMLARNLPVGQLEYQYRDSRQPKQQQDQPEDSQDSGDAE